MIKNKVVLTAAKTDDMTAIATTEATTLDLSEGGMRLTTQKPLLDAALLQFAFDKTFPKDLQSGIGVVTWCNLLIDKPVYQIGIQFKNRTTNQAMKQYLKKHTKA